MKTTADQSAELTHPLNVEISTMDRGKPSLTPPSALLVNECALRTWRSERIGVHAVILLHTASSFHMTFTESITLGRIDEPRLLSHASPALAMTEGAARLPTLRHLTQSRGGGGAGRYK